MEAGGIVSRFVPLRISAGLISQAIASHWLRPFARSIVAAMEKRSSFSCEAAISLDKNWKNPGDVAIADGCGQTGGKLALGFFSLRHGVVQKFRCKMGSHHRDGDTVRRVDKKWRSVCTGCGASMIKVGDEWMLRSEFLARDDLSGNAHYSNL